MASPSCRRRRMTQFENPNIFAPLETETEENESLETNEARREGGASYSGDSKAGMEKLKNAAKAEGRKNQGGPPIDDCCPICFGNFTVPCKTQCGHWYCATCILQVWNYAAASKPCKCPVCCREVTKLSPEGLQYQRQDQEVIEVLQKVERYNRIFVGGALGAVQKLRECPLFLKRLFMAMMDPDRPYSYVSEMRMFAIILSIIYMVTPFDFIPTGGLGIVRVFDYGAIILVMILRLVGIFRKWQLTRRVRQLAMEES